MERLRNRLGEGCVQQLHCKNDHLPELAHQITAYDADKKALTAVASTSNIAKRRPLWLLAQPQPLTISTQGPWLHSSLQMSSGPERIESAWWTPLKARRDYYIAHNSQQQRLWVFQDICHPAQWFLHGIF